MKGGAGKSLVTIHLAATLAKEKGKKVLILDVDNQRSISEWFAAEKEEDKQPLMQVEELKASQVPTYLRRHGEKYDVVFIDIPRITDVDNESPAIMLLHDCDAILVPVIGSQMDVLSSLDFLKLLKRIREFEQKQGYDLNFHGFINRRNQRSENREAEEVLREQGLPMFDSSLSDLKILTYPSFYTSIMDTKEGRRRFEPFFNEFCTKFKI